MLPLGFSYKVPTHVYLLAAQDALKEALLNFGRASHYTLIARGNVIEVLCELQLHVSPQTMLPEACFSADWYLLLPVCLLGVLVHKQR